ncbi:MAG: VWA domain-containing protein, partial [Spirochaetia bacterium]|nr:VWA domain-containing protein [Spirochaetia bacterium]
MISKAVVFVLAGVMFAALGACSRQARHFLVMVDTSGSMSGPGKTIDKVKQSLPQLLNTVRPGDSVTIGSFDERAQVGETIAIKSESDKSKVTEAIKALKAEGPYTDMYGMVDRIKEKTQELEKLGGQVYVVILTDGLDDP